MSSGLTLLLLRLLLLLLLLLPLLRLLWWCRSTWSRSYKTFLRNSRFPPNYEITKSLLRWQKMYKMSKQCYFWSKITLQNCWLQILKWPTLLFHQLTFLISSQTSFITLTTKRAKLGRLHRFVHFLVDIWTNLSYFARD